MAWFQHQPFQNSHNTPAWSCITEFLLFFVEHWICSGPMCEKDEQRLVCCSSWHGRVGIGYWCSLVLSRSTTFGDYYYGSLQPMVTTGDYCCGAQLLMVTIGDYSLLLRCTATDGDYWPDTAEDTLWLLPWHTMTDCDYWRLLLWCTLYISLLHSSTDGDYWRLQLLMVTIGQTQQRRRHGRVAWEAILQFGGFTLLWRVIL